MNKKLYEKMAVAVVIALIASGLFGPKYSIIELAPLAIVGFLAFAFFKFETPSKNARLQMLGVLIVFYGVAFLALNDAAGDRREKRALYRECEKYFPQSEPLQPFGEICANARSWYWDQY